MAKRKGEGRREKKQKWISPTCRAILLCDRVIKDAFTSTTTLVGILTRFNVTKFPGYTPEFYIFVQLAHGHTTAAYNLTIEIQDDQKGTVLARSSPIPLKFSYRTEVRDIISQIPPIPLKHAGRYTVAVIADGIEVAHQDFDTPEDGEDHANPEPDATR